MQENGWSVKEEGKGNFRDELWSCVSPGIIDSILEHPFIQGLIDGTLPEATFRAYIVQDHKYLDTYGRVLNILAAKAPLKPHCKTFTEAASNVYQVEMALHSRLLKQWKLDEATVDDMEEQPACLAYTSFLLAIVGGQPFHEGLAAVLPCYWIYQHVGQFLKAKGSSKEIYQAWIDLYGGAEFDQAVSVVLDMMDEVAEGLHETQKVRCKHHFKTAARMEYMFWDGPYKGHVWPC